MTDLNALRKRLKRTKPGPVAEKSGLSTKTVKRIRDGLNSPTLKTFLRLDAALKALQPVKAR